MGTTLVLVGPHGAGKTTLGRVLAARLGVPFEEEIGKRLRNEALARDPLQHAMLAQPDFDAAVFREELDRDAAHRPGVVRVVETWHPGNLAYAAARSAGEAARWRSVVDAHVAPWRGVVRVQPLALGRATARARLTEPGPDAEALLDFFADVGAAMVANARALGLEVLPALDTDDAPVEGLAEVVLRRIGGRGLRTA